VVLALLAGWLLGVPGWKWVRRRRRRTGAPAAAVVGAWLEVRDCLRDSGVVVSEAMTPRDLAAVAAPHGASLRRLGECVDLALWSGGAVEQAVASAAWRNVAEVRARLREQPLRRRLRAALTPRGLRPPASPHDRGPGHATTGPRAPVRRRSRRGPTRP
jgi:hypothetical protein